MPTGGSEATYAETGNRRIFLGVIRPISPAHHSNYRATAHWSIHNGAGLNPPMTARVKISQNVDTLAKVHLVHLKIAHCQTLRVVSTFTGQNESTFLTGESIVWYCSGWSK